MAHVMNYSEIKDAADKGKIIGKDGCIIKAVRTVLNAAAAKQDKKVTLKLED
jgi:predicted RNA-binding protein YlqC (UPF0109 family)